jgi:hypothetical protein
VPQDAPTRQLFQEAVTALTRQYLPRGNYCLVPHGKRLKEIGACAHEMTTA